MFGETIDMVKPKNVRFDKDGNPIVDPRVLLFRYFEDNGISLEAVSEKTEYSLNYLRNLRSGSDDLTNSAKFKFAVNYPATVEFLLKSEDSEGN